MVLGFYSGYYWLQPRPIMGHPVLLAHGLRGPGPSPTARNPQRVSQYSRSGPGQKQEDAHHHHHRRCEQVKLYLPSIRSGILMLVSQRTSTELLQREGKEKLAADILREVSRPLGYTVPTERARAAAADKEEDAEDRPSRRRTERNPVHRVLFSSFIIQ